MANEQLHRQAHGEGQDALVDALVEAAFATIAVLQRVCAENDLSLTQLRVLAILRDRRVKMSELANYLGLEKSTMSGLVLRAERRGLVERTPNASDGRSVDVALTRAGMALAHELGTVTRTSLGPMTSRLEAAERHDLIGLLDRLRADD